MTGPATWLEGAHVLDSVDALRRCYRPPHEVVLRKQINRLDVQCQRLIAASPFLVLATSGPAGVDCSPRGGPPGFAQVHDETTLLLPDRPGNNRLDSLQNIVANPAVGLVFLLPGRNEVLRVNGRAAISVHPELLERFTEDGLPPRAVLVIRVEEAFIHCPRALRAAGLWDPACYLPVGAVPSMQEVLAAHLLLAEDAEGSRANRTAAHASQLA